MLDISWVILSLLALDVFVFKPLSARRLHNRLCLIEKGIVEGYKMVARTLDDLLAQGTAVLAQVTANTDLEKSIVALQLASAQTIQDLRDQLTAAGQDATKLSALGDAMDAIAAKVKEGADAAATAATSNTPAQPAA